MKNIGLIGLGNAGRPIAERLLRKGYSLKVYDLNPEPVEALVKLGASKAANAFGTVQEATLMVLPSSVEVKAAVFGPQGVLEGIGPGRVLIDLSGTDPDCSQELEKKIGEKGGAFLGGTLHADGAPHVTIPKGLVSIVMGGEKKPFEECADILKALAQKVIYVPEPWIPKALKIGVIMLAVANTVMTAEVLTWLSAQGINPTLFLRILETTGSPASASRVAGFFRRHRSQGGTLSNTYKDLSQALKSAGDLSLPLPFAAVANQIQEMGRAQGLSRSGSSAAIAEVYESLTKVSLSQAVLEGGRSFDEPGNPEIIYLDGEK